jgi:hypothetical protein
MRVGTGIRSNRPSPDPQRPHDYRRNQSSRRRSPPGHQKSIAKATREAYTLFAPISMKRSASVTLTLVVALTAARAQQTADPSDAATFNKNVCKSAVRRGAYCSQGAQFPTSYQQSYPYYYDLYRNYVSQGGAVTPSSVEICRGGSAAHGGFGSTGAAHGGGSKGGS